MEQQARIYKDLDLAFIPHPIRKDVNKKTGYNAIIQSVKNLVLLSHYEKPFHPEIGGNIRKMLFEPLDPITANIIAKEIDDVITNFEPRVDLSSIDVTENYDGNGYDVIVTFFLLNTEEPIQTTIFLERLR
jgi:phage baseplate assembly protein W